MLNVNQLKSLRIGLYAVGGVTSLYVRVTKTGKSWVFNFQMAGRRRYMGLGSLADVGLAR